ncbi:hypothetical protein Holit_01093 [Hollandina sp. SP2]
MVIGIIPYRPHLIDLVMLFFCTAKNDTIQFMLLCFAIISMFVSQGSILLANSIVFIKLLSPLILFFIVNYFLSLFVGKKLKLSFQDTIPLLFTTSARNSPIALTIAIITFPSEPIIALVLVMGPLIELPVLAINSTILRRWMEKNRPLTSYDVAS